MPVISGRGRRENLYSKGQKFLSREGRDNWDRIFRNDCGCKGDYRDPDCKHWADTGIKYPEEVKKDAWGAQLRRHENSGTA